MQSSQIFRWRKAWVRKEDYLQSAPNTQTLSQPLRMTIDGGTARFTESYQVR